MNIGPAELFIVCGISLFFLVIVVGAGVVIRRMATQSKVSDANDQSRRVACPYCAELILPEAKICRYCGKDLA